MIEQYIEGKITNWEGLTMSVDIKTAEKLWKDVFGSKVWARDCFGTLMHRDAYSNVEVNMRWEDGKIYDMSWNVDHIRPVSDFLYESDADFWNNYEPMHRQNNQEKAAKYPQFTIHRKNYLIVNSSVCKQHGVKGYGIRDESTGKEIDWKAIQNDYYR